MPALLEAKDDKPKKNDLDEKPPVGDQLNAPKLDKGGKPTRRAVSEGKQAWQIAKRLRENGRRVRIPRNAEINKRYNGTEPFPRVILERTGQTWRNNWSTQFLASIIDRVRPVFVDNITRSKYLTLASLPARFPDAARKSQVFRDNITRTIRSWQSWDDLISVVTQENVLIGYATPAWLDDDWRVRMFRSDEIFFPEGTSQDAAQVQYFAVEQSLLVHEFIDLFENEGAARLAGYDIANCVEIINEQFGEAKTEDRSEIKLADKAREGGISTGYEEEAKTIELLHLVVREYEGGVDVWTVDAKKGRTVRHKEGVHDEMPDATVLFSMQTGNTKLYGSKGIGRLLVNIATGIERGRCHSADQMYLSGLLVVQCDEADFNTVQPVVRHPFIVLPTGVKVATQSIQFDATAAAAQDARLVEIAESIAGSFIPPQITQDTGTPTSRIKDAQNVARQEAVKQGVLSRFYRQFAKMIEGKQRKICSPLILKEALRVREDRERKKQEGVIIVAKKVMDWIQTVVSKEKRDAKVQAAYESKIADLEAVECVVSMLDEGLTIEEIATLALSPATETLDRENADNDNATSQWLQIAAQTPFVDKKEALKMGAEIAGVSEDRVNRVMLPEVNDPTVDAEQVRQQIQEWHLLMDGEPMVPVSGRDKHPIHRRVLVDKLAPLMEAVSASLQATPGQPGATMTPEILTLAKGGLQHYREHLALDMEGDPNAIQQEGEALAVWEKQLADAAKTMAKLAEEAAALGVSPGEMPVPVAGQPIGTLNGGAPGEAPVQEDQSLDFMRQGAELTMRAKEIAQTDRKLDLDTAKHEHKVMVDTAQKQLDAAKLMVDSAARAATPRNPAPGVQ